MRYERKSVRRHGRRSRDLTLAAIALLVVAAIFVNRDFEGPCTEVHGSQLVNLSLSELKAGTARKFCYRDPHGEVIRFIVARDADGTIHSAFDACRGCYEQHLGYSVAGTDLVCRYCNLRYPVKGMETRTDSCVPIRLPHAILADAVQIKVVDLEAGRRLFLNSVD
jgi:uncharacterized membrane protein